MQDIGGCRVVFENIEDAYDCLDQYKKKSESAKIICTKDYILQPQDTGYRGIHLIFRYNNRKEPNYTSKDIEIQIRTQLQHIWATTVEVAGIFIQQALKSSQGDEDWLKYFSLSSKIFAYEEGSSDSPSKEELGMIKKIGTNLRVKANLTAYSRAFRTFSSSNRFYSPWIVLELNFKERRLHMHRFANRAGAIDAYNEMEKEKGMDENIDMVLVSVNDVNSLQKAYPNYYLETQEFLDIIHGYVRHA